jgi:hypothetical protein
VFDSEKIPLDELGDLRRIIADLMLRGIVRRIEIARLEDFWIKNDNGEYECE